MTEKKQNKKSKEKKLQKYDFIALKCNFQPIIILKSANKFIALKCKNIALKCKNIALKCNFTSKKPLNYINCFNAAKTAFDAVLLFVYYMRANPQEGSRQSLLLWKC